MCNRAVQLGRIPVYIYTVIPWLPYAGTNISFEKFGFVGFYNAIASRSNLHDLVHSMRNITVTEYERKMDKVREVRMYYTYEGFFGELKKFLRDPFGAHGGYLRCGPHPKTSGAAVSTN